MFNIASLVLGMVSGTEYVLSKCERKGGIERRREGGGEEGRESKGGLKEKGKKRRRKSGKEERQGRRMVGKKEGLEKSLM